jgi:hypothetical protein
MLKSTEEREARQESAFTERHYRVQELATLWNLSPAVIRRLFRKEPGVRSIGQSGSSSKRSYTTMLIPASVADRVYASLFSPRVAS